MFLISNVLKHSFKQNGFGIHPLESITQTQMKQLGGCFGIKV